MKKIKYIGAVAALVLSVACASAQSTNTPATNAPTVVPIAQTTVSQGLWRFSVSGRGVANVASPATANNNSTYGGEIEISHALKLGLPGEIGIRQDFNYSEYTVNTVTTVTVPVVAPPCCSVGPGDTTTTTKNVKSTKSAVQYGTKVFYDWQLLKVGNFAVDAGVNAGAYYGNGQSVDWQVSPEADVRLFLLKNVNAFGRVEYPYSISQGGFTGGLVYSVGLQYRF